VKNSKKRRWECIIVSGQKKENDSLNCRKLSSSFGPGFTVKLRNHDANVGENSNSSDFVGNVSAMSMCKMLLTTISQFTLLIEPIAKLSWIVPECRTHCRASLIKRCSRCRRCRSYWIKRDLTHLRQWGQGRRLVKNVFLFYFLISQLFGIVHCVCRF